MTTGDGTGRRGRRAVLTAAAAAVTVVVIGCGGSPAPAPSAAVRALRTMVVPRVCGGVGGGAVLTGDPADPHVAWLDGSATRDELVWPAGYWARFGPSLEILDAGGSVIYRAGDIVDEACAVGPAEDPPSRLLILPPRR